jgi:uncharacterized protein
MAFTAAEKLQIAMLCDLAKPPANRELDYEFIDRVVMDDDLWALDTRYPGLELGIKWPPKVKKVADILEMWYQIESGFESLTDADKTRVETESFYRHPPKFLGFSGNEETDLMSISRLFVNDLSRWEHFRDRDLNSHFPSVGSYQRMLSVWKPLLDSKIRGSGGPYELTQDELIAILREHVHPEHRKPQAGGGWTFDRPKLPE